MNRYKWYDQMHGIFMELMLVFPDEERMLAVLLSMKNMLDQWGSEETAALIREWKKEE